jgi:hypothetical protein
MGEDAPKLEDVVEALMHASSVRHEPLGHLQIPKHDVVVVDSPSTDLDESSSDLERTRRLMFVRRDSVNASSGLSDVDTPVTQSKFGKLKQIETLGDLIEEKEQAEKTGADLPARELAVLQPTTADQVDDVKDKLEGFTHSSGEIKQILATIDASPSNPAKAQAPAPAQAPVSPLFKATTGKAKVKSRSGFDSDDDSSGEEEFSDSGSDSEFEIFPPVDPKKMKLHPPVKLDIQQLEKKLGTSLSQRTRAAASKGEISEAHQ